MSRVLLVFALGAFVPGCGDSQEAPRLFVPVKIGPPVGLTTTNDTGWTVTVTSFRAVIADLEFTIEGEVHLARDVRPRNASNLLARLAQIVIPSAHAHPGHLAGGETTGALPGVYSIDWVNDVGRVLGNAELIAGEYSGVNMSLTRGSEMLAMADPLRSSTALISGRAERNGVSVSFTASLLVDAGSRVIGAPLSFTVGPRTTGALALSLVLADPVSGRRFFDQIDFATLDPDGDGRVEIQHGSPEGNTLRRPLQDHAHYTASPVP
jgi:hypothetical protein